MKTESIAETRLKRSPLKIRQMDIDDVAPVFHLGEALFRAEESPNTYRTWDKYEVVELFYADSEYCLVASLEDEIVGFCLGNTITKTHSAWKYGYLVWLGVAPAFQRSGVAEKLFRRFKDIMLKHNVRMLVADTEEENLPALKFFRKQGFRNPQKHIYLTMNLENERMLIKKKNHTGFHEK